MSISDEEYNQMKAKLKKRSRSLLIVGLLVVITGITMIPLSFVFSDFGPNPALMFPAIFLLFIGIVLCMIGFQLWYATKMDKLEEAMDRIEKFTKTI